MYSCSRLYRRKLHTAKYAPAADPCRIRGEDITTWCERIRHASASQCRAPAAKVRCQRAREVVVPVLEGRVWRRRIGGNGDMHCVVTLHKLEQFNSHAVFNQEGSFETEVLPFIVEPQASFDSVDARRVAEGVRYIEGLCNCHLRTVRILPAVPFMK